MDKIEKIRQEIERRIKLYDGNNTQEMWTGNTYRAVLSFLDTLSEEPDKSLEEEIRKYLSDRWKFGCCTPVTPVVLPNYTTVDLEECANHFAEWGAEHLRDSTKMVDKSLEEAAEEYIKNGRYLPEAWVVRPAFKAGAEWQKSQMLKDAFVDSYVVHDGRIELEGDPLPCLNPIILLPYPQFKPGDKVKVIIVKED